MTHGRAGVRRWAEAASIASARQTAVLVLAASVGCSGLEPPSAVDGGRQLSPSDASYSVSSATVVTLPYQFDLDDLTQIMYWHEIYGIGRSGMVTGRARSKRYDFYTSFRWSPSAGVEDMGNPPGPDNYGAGLGINSGGEVVGSGLSQDSYGDDYVSIHAYRMTQPQTGSCSSSCGVVDLGGPKTLAKVSAAYAINDAGQVTGEYDGIASLWSASNIRTTLGTLGGSTSTGRAINSRGAVVGWSARADGRTHAFIKTADGTMRDLGSFEGRTSMAVGINDAYEVVGSSTLRSGASHAFLWTPSGGMKDLGTLLGGTASAATGINSAGAVIGWSTVTGGAVHAFLWTRAGGMEDITPKTGITNPGGLSDNYRTYEGIKIYTLVF
ncbi:MAG: hypothetical protein ABI601_06440 [bacterium]